MKRRVLSCVVAAFAIALVVAPSAYAGHDDMQALPTTNKFGCTNCHNGPSVTPTQVPPQEALSLNQFGVDWLNFGSAWSLAFARLNSDGDGCTNGYEMGDPSGVWRDGDAKVSIASADQRNPGDASDCALPINHKNWGTLKSLFGND